MASPPPSAAPPKKTLPSVRQIDQTQDTSTRPLPKRIRTHSPQHQILYRPPPLLTDTTASSGQPYQPTTSTVPNPSIHKEGRRIWNRRFLAQNGASQTLLEALDTFSANVPVIPTNLDPSRKMYIRNMRGWIMHLALPVHDPIWHALINVLRTDTSLTTIGLHWDQDLCRYILAKIVQDNQSKQHQPKQSRQAVNNAIKRELTCPTESGNSSRGKTFRDLFREKCKAGGVTLPNIEPSARIKRPPDSSHKIHPHPETTAASSLHTQPRVTITGGGGEDSYVSVPLPNTPGKTPPPGLVDDTELSRLRAQCPDTDQWNRTAWWRLTDDEDVKRIPLLLAHSHLYELHALLTDFRWIARTFHCVDFSKGMRQVPTDGYDVMLEHAQRPGTDCSPVDIEGFRLMRNAIMVILPILSKETASSPSDPTFIAHLATQLVGRLLDLKRGFPNIAYLIQSIEEYAPRPWLRPLARCFHQPRTDIKLAVPSNGIFTPHLIVLSEDGTLLATSGSSIVEVQSEPSRSTMTRSTTSTARSTNTKDSMGTWQVLKRKRSSIVIWDVQSGRCVCKGPELPNYVRHLSLSRDNNCIIGETVDGLFFWHLDKSKDMWTISSQMEAAPRIKSVSSITAAVGSTVLTTHRLDQEPMIVLWDTKTGQKLDNFNRVTSKPKCVDISARGDYFASGHDNGFIHLWTMKEKVPVLSFKNEGADRGPQQVVALSDVNRTGETEFKPISISFYEKGEERWLTAVSSNDIIRVWLLPPRHISHDQWKSFVSSRRTAVLRCPGIKDVQWSENGNFFTGGEDGIARMWRRLENGKWEWEWYAIDKENRESRSTVSTVLLSCGKRSGLVATYVAKSPYVTVWDMSRMAVEIRSRKRRWLYRSYIPMIGTSMDAKDIGHLTCLDSIGHETYLDGNTGGRNEQVVKDSNWRSRYEDEFGMIRNGMIRNDLEKFFGNLDTKSTTTPEGEQQPWLRMVPGGRMEGPGEGKALRVCFEQSVLTGQSGVFKTDQRRKDTSIRDMYIMSTRMEGEGWEGEVKRRGMVAALNDGTIGVFELEGVKGGVERKEEGELIKVEKGVGEGVGGAESGSINDEDDGTDE